MFLIRVTVWIRGQDHYWVFTSLGKVRNRDTGDTEGPVVAQGNQGSVGPPRGLCVGTDWPEVAKKGQSWHRDASSGTVGSGVA